MSALEQNVALPLDPQPENPKNAKIWAAMNAVMLEVHGEGGIAKDRQNQAQKFAYRGVDDMFNALCSVLARNHITPRAVHGVRSFSEHRSNSGGALLRSIGMSVVYFTHAEDQSVCAVQFCGESMDSGDKGVAKSQTMALKQACLHTFLVPTEGDNDGDATTHAVAPSAAAQAPAPRAAATPAAPRAARPANVNSGPEETYRFGKLKGQPLSAGSERDLEWYGEAVEKSIHDPDKARFSAANRTLLAAIRAEQARRSGGSAQHHEEHFDTVTGEIIDPADIAADDARRARAAQEMGTDDLPF